MQTILQKANIRPTQARNTVDDPVLRARDRKYLLIQHLPHHFLRPLPVRTTLPIFQHPSCYSRPRSAPHYANNSSNSRTYLFLTARICSVSSMIILFVEVPLLLRICPTSSTFDAYIRKVSTNYMRAGAYAVMALVQWLSIIPKASSLIAAAVVLSATGVCYGLAGLKGQAFVGSKTLGGQGVAQMIV